jgi:hypothetical protein
VPSTPGSVTAKIFGDSGTGRLGEKVKSGDSGYFVVAQRTDVVTTTVTAATLTRLTKEWTIAANDAASGTTYRLKASGYGTWGSTQQSLTANPMIDGANIGAGGGVGSIAAAALPISQKFYWNAEYNFIIVTAGASGAARANLEFIAVARASGISPGTAATNSITTMENVPSDPASVSDFTIDTTVSHTIAVYVAWASTTGAPTLTCKWTSLERVGP